VSDTDARLWHPWRRINRVLRVMLHTRWSAEAWSQVRVEFKRALALRSEFRRAGVQTNPERLTRLLYIYMLLTLAMAGSALWKGAIYPGIAGLQRLQRLLTARRA
jgi:hypothetical protein